MPNWKELLDEAKATGTTFDVVRRKYLKELSDFTGRNTIIYYSGWLQKGDMVRPTFRGFNVDDNDKNGFMATIHKLDRSKGLDLLLHTPGGSTAATESLVDYLRTMFGTNVRAIVPQLAMSAGTMIALSCKSIVLGKHSSLGPIDPQFNGIPAHGVLEEFQTARKEILADPRSASVWAPILAKYHPTLIGECQKAIKWSKDMCVDWLVSGMFASDKNPRSKARRIVNELADHIVTLSHARHYSAERAKTIGLVVEQLEANPELQDKVLTVHHACIQTLSGSVAYKIIENQIGVAYIQQLTPYTAGE